MRVQNHPDADAELLEAAFFYEQRSPGLGSDFVDEFEATIARIRAKPRRPRRIRENIRQMNLHRFPYAVIYEIRADAIHVLAIMHLHRRPFYWISRQAR